MSKFVNNTLEREDFFSLNNIHNHNNPNVFPNKIQTIDISNEYRQKKQHQICIGQTMKDSVLTMADSTEFLHFRKTSPKKKLKGLRKKGSLNHQKILNEKKVILNVDKFKFIGKLGAGSNSQVYAAIHIDTGLFCAIKVFQKKHIQQMKMEEHLKKQILIHASLSHPNIVNLWGFFDDQQYVYLITQPCSDGTLYSRLSEQRKNKPQQGLQIYEVANCIGQLSRAVQYLHSKNIMHRDIKPQNILLTMYSTIKLSDFGQSVINQQSNLRKTLCGTPLYLAPQLIKSLQYNESIDVWAIGIVTFELLTGHIPFKIKSISDLKRIVSDDICYNGIKSWIARDFVRKMLEKDGHKRVTIKQLCKHNFLKEFDQDF